MNVENATDMTFFACDWERKKKKQKDYALKETKEKKNVMCRAKKISQV